MYSNFQNDIYAKGMLGGVRPAYPTEFDGWHEAAHQKLTPEAYGYIAGSAGLETTAHANRAAFARWEIIPRMLRDTSKRDTSVEILGKRWDAPIALAPIGVMTIAHEEGEVAVARGASRRGVPMIASTAAAKPMEEIAAALHDTSGNETSGRGWYQLYWSSDRDVALSFVRRAEAAGFEAIVVTVDTWQLAWRPRDLVQAFLPFLRGEGVANFLSDPVFQSRLEKSPQEDPEAAIRLWGSIFGNPALTFDDIAWLREQTSLPILVKGIQHPDDATACIDAGADGVVVSNHGGRQVDGARASLDCLPDIVSAIGGSTILFDSGVRCGADIMKALALGADAVLIGRPMVYGLALGGAEGVEHVLQCLQADFELNMVLSGIGNVADIDRTCLVRADD
ncbi:L-lactate dehydrogenase (cytochrome) [Antricoccus suffuscus]|uniref:L-lactate dehydrogenase (Cytochrome) n=1 Tax=Antricoccus suffuscus TaxID=1629062 RepID=A0A2T0ZFZ0_9ACTN|nr:lactate 2-monooxygenase [Antricoccus suffuscus]PRZ35221.1 L-lactate dehydrogenase (cytochrome) [Antricoccus suffuscus]